MASSLHHLLLLSMFLLMASPSISALTCTSQKLTKTYSTCMDLPALDAQLHYTYDAANSSLNVAFLAPATNSWIAWAINPTGVGMVGAQALMALKPESGSIEAKTFNISSYHSVVESKLSFEVWELSADESSGTMRLFGSVKVPAGETKLNQVWQVGSAVAGTHPKIHDMTPDNRKSKGTLELKKDAAGAPAATPPTSNASSSGASSSGAPARMLKGGVVGIIAALVWMMMSI